MDEQAKLERVFNYRFGDIYANYLAKVERKGHTREELDDILGWFTGLDSDGLEAAQDLSLRDFFSQISLHPNTNLITGTVCGVRVQEVEDVLMQKIRRMDLLIDEIARGKSPTRIKR